MEWKRHGGKIEEDSREHHKYHKPFVGDLVGRIRSEKRAEQLKKEKESVTEEGKSPSNFPRKKMRLG